MGNPYNTYSGAADDASGLVMFAIFVFGVFKIYNLIFNPTPPEAIPQVIEIVQPAQPPNVIVVRDGKCEVDYAGATYDGPRTATVDLFIAVELDGKRKEVQQYRIHAGQAIQEPADAPGRAWVYCFPSELAPVGTGLPLDSEHWVSGLI